MRFGKTRLAPVVSCAGRRFGLALALMVAGGAVQGAAADSQARTISLHHIHTKEDLTVTFKRNGRFDDAAVGKLNWFLRDWRRDEQTKIDPQLFDMMWEVAQEVGGSEPIHIISAYRSPATNAMLRRRGRGVAQFSQHMMGKAIDFTIPNAPLEKLRVAGLRLHGGGVGYYPSSGAPFVHMDTGSIRHWPRMTREQLVRAFPNGRTVHVPSDGNPLPGYELALADVQKRGSKSVTSLAASRGGVQTASTEKPGFFARLLGAKDEDEEEAPVQTRRRGTATAALPSEEAEEKSLQLASAIPMPRAQPFTRPQAAEIAAAVPEISSQSVRPSSGAYALASANPNSAQIVEARGVWGGARERAADAVRAAPANEPRLAWSVGPQGRTLGEHSTVRKSGERPRGVAVASAGGDFTGSLPPWPDSGNKEGRVPSEMVLAYAAAGPAETIVRPTIVGSAMRLSSPPKPAAPRRAGSNLSQQDPWLRGLVLAPSIKASMAVAVLGAPDYRALASFMHKPRAIVPVRFTTEAEGDMPSDRFQGKALEFPATIRFGGIMTARAN